MAERQQKAAVAARGQLPVPGGPRSTQQAPAVRHGRSRSSWTRGDRFSDRRGTRGFVGSPWLCAVTRVGSYRIPFAFRQIFFPFSPPFLFLFLTRPQSSRNIY